MHKNFLRVDNYGRERYQICFQKSRKIEQKKENTKFRFNVKVVMSYRVGSCEATGADDTHQDADKDDGTNIG